MKISSLKMQDHLIASSLANAELFSNNLIVGPNGVGKTRILNNIKQAVATDAKHIPIFLIKDKGYDLTEITKAAKRYDLSFDIALTDILKNDIDIIRAVEPNFGSMSVVDGSIAVTFKDGITCINVEDMGKGFGRLIEILLNCYYLYDGVLLIDDVELGLQQSHYSKVISCIIEYAKVQRNQVFMTTHSNDVVECYSEYTSVKRCFDDHKVNASLIRLGSSVRELNRGEVVAAMFDEQTLKNMLDMGIRLA